MLGRFGIDLVGRTDVDDHAILDENGYVLGRFVRNPVDQYATADRCLVGHHASYGEPSCISLHYRGNCVQSVIIHLYIPAVPLDA